MNEKRVLIIGPGIKTRGGITSVISAHEIFFQSMGIQADWLHTHETGGVTKKIHTLLLGIFSLLKHLYSRQYSVIWVHGSEIKSALRKCIFILICKVIRPRTPIVFHLHAFNTDLFKFAPRNLVYKFLFGMSARVVALSEGWKSMIISSGVNPGKVTAIPNPCMLELDSSTDKRPVILYAGAFEKRKGIDVLVEAFLRINKDFPGWELWLAGGTIEELRKVGSSNLEHSLEENRVRILGWIEAENKKKIFAIAKIFCLPSLQEGFPMAILEAWASGCAVVATKVGGARDFFDGTNALEVRVGDVEDLATKLSKLMGDKLWSERIARAGNRTGMQKAGPPVVVASLKQLIDELSC